MQCSARPESTALQGAIIREEWSTYLRLCSSLESSLSRSSAAGLWFVRDQSSLLQPARAHNTR
eukprot:22204-Eustigmatos_ZCMA.PRE.1